jgi:hypothetical protein
LQIFQLVVEFSLLKTTHFWKIHVQDLEKEMIKLIREDRRIEGVRADLKRQAERLARLASLKVIADPPKVCV